MSEHGPIERIEGPAAQPTPIRAGVELAAADAEAKAIADDAADELARRRNAQADDAAGLWLGWGDPESAGPNCRATCATCGPLISVAPLADLVGYMRAPIVEFDPSDLAGGWETSADADQVIECITNGHAVTIERL